MTPLLLIGGGGHCKSCIDVIEKEGQYKIEGVLDQTLEFGTKVLGYKVLGSDQDLGDLITLTPHVLIALGHIKSSAPRERLFNTVKALGGVFPTLVSPLAHLSRHASVGEGTIIMHGVMVNAGGKVGNNSILNSQSLVEHDVRVGDHCHISTGAKINGGVNIGAGTFIGSGAIIHEGVKIGENCVIGAGVIVRKNQTSEMILRDSL